MKRHVTYPDSIIIVAMTIHNMQTLPDQSAEGFAALVETHWTAVYRLLYTMTGNPHDTEDLTQEAFLRALKRWQTFTPGTERGWMLRIATNVFLDMRRKEKLRKTQTLPRDVQGDCPDVADPMVVGEQAEIVRTAMGDLTELTRLVFHLRVTEELSYPEIAKLAGTTVPSARWHMCHARSRLLKQLGEVLV